MCGLFGMDIDTEGQVSQPTAKSPWGGDGSCSSKSALIAVNDLSWDWYCRAIQAYNIPFAQGKSQLRLKLRPLENSIARIPP